MALYGRIQLVLVPPVVIMYDILIYLNMYNEFKSWLKKNKSLGDIKILYLLYVVTTYIRHFLLIICKYKTNVKYLINSYLLYQKQKKYLKEGTFSL